MHARGFYNGDMPASVGVANVDSMARAALRHSHGVSSLDDTYRHWRNSELASGLDQLNEGWSQKFPGSDEIWLSEKAVGDLAGLAGSDEDRFVIGMLKSLKASVPTVDGTVAGLAAYDAGPHYRIYSRRLGNRLQVVRVLPNQDRFAALLQNFMAGEAH